MPVEFGKPSPNPALRAIVYGPPGSGKTHFALKCPGPVIVLDTEGGTRAYGSREGFDFTVAETNSPTELEEVLDRLYSGSLKAGTFVVDSATVLNNVIKMAQQEVADGRALKAGRSVDDASLTMRDWGKVKARVASLVTKIMGVPCHLVMTAWIKPVYAPGVEMQKIGETFDADPKFAYAPDMVVKMAVKGTGDQAVYTAVIEKDRTGKYKTGQIVENPEPSMFLPSGNGTVKAVPSEDSTAKKEAKLVEQHSEVEVAGTVESAAKTSPATPTPTVRVQGVENVGAKPGTQPADREVLRRRSFGCGKALELFIGPKGWPDSGRFAKLCALLAMRDGDITKVDQLSDAELAEANSILYRATKGDVDCADWVKRLAEKC